MTVVRFPNYKSIEERPSFMGIPLFDLLILLFAFIGLSLLGAAGMVLGIFMPLYFVFVFVLFLASLVAFKVMNKQKHPSLLISFISYHFIQKKTHRVKQGRLILKKRS